MFTIKNTVRIGKIVKSNSHIDYACQVYGPGEIDELPQPTDYSFGTFISIDLADNGLPDNQLIGVLYNTLLMNPDFGNLGPRLSPRQEVEIFTPDYLAETAILVGVIALGWMDEEGIYHQGVPAISASVNNTVRRLTKEELHTFHCNGQERLCLHYIPLLLNHNNPLVPQLMLTILDKLRHLFPDNQRQLSVLRNNISWKSIVEPVG